MHAFLRRSIEKAFISVLDQLTIERMLNFSVNCFNQLWMNWSSKVVLSFALNREIVK